GMLTPGFFARLRIPGSARYEAILVPDSAIGTDQDQRNVLIVNNDNKVESRKIQLGARFGGLRAVVSGITSDDRIIINGLMHARPGSVVAPDEQPIKVDEAA